MGKPGNLECLLEYFNEGNDFELTKDEFEKLTKGILSSNIYYIKNKSKLSRFAKSNSYYIEIIPAEIRPMKICFKKEKKGE